MDSYEFMEVLSKAKEEGKELDDLVEDYLFLRRVRIEKTGLETRVFCTETDRELVFDGKKVSLDFARDKRATVKVTFEVAVDQVIIREKQMSLLGGLGDSLKEGESMTLSTGGTSATIHGRNKNKN